MIRLIINADDFGLSEKINFEIIKSYRYGLLRSASLMANGKSFDNAVKMISDNPDLDIGVHLTLVAEKPLLAPDNVRSLLNADGFFNMSAVKFAKKYFMNKIDPFELKSECSAQIEKIIAHGIKPTHIDSHQHVHVLPDIFRIVTDLAKKYKIPFIRIPKEDFQNYMLRNQRFYGRVIQMFLLNILCSQQKRNDVMSLDHFAGFYFGGHLNKNNILRVINNLPSDGVCELMCHPGFDMSSSQNKTYRMVEESISLVDDEVFTAIKDNNIIITSFEELLKSKQI
jgi:predicted glycoside hydrolase/deacetylase ChbG (UPF0249 family)